MRYILRIAKISVNISDIFCKSQKIPQKIPQKKTKKTYGSYMQFSCHTLGGDELFILPDSKIKSWHSEKLCFVSFCIKETKFGAKLTKVHNICFSDSSFPSNPLHLIPRHRQAGMSGWGGACAQMCTGSSQEAGICVMGPRFKWQETNPWHEAVTASCWVELHLHRWPSLGWDKIFSEKFLLKFHGSRSRRSVHS